VSACRSLKMCTSAADPHWRSLAASLDQDQRSV
jgi:hypothetical protein